VSSLKKKYQRPYSFELQGNQFLNHLQAKIIYHLISKTAQNDYAKWLGLNDFYSCKTKTKYWAICSGLTDNTDNYSMLEPLLPNVQTNLQQSLDSEPKESRVIVVTSGKEGLEDDSYC
jgi:hypothetical protein